VWTYIRACLQTHINTYPHVNKRTLKHTSFSLFFLSPTGREAAANVFLVKNRSQKSVLLIENRSSQMSLPYHKWVFKNRCSLAKIRVSSPKIRVELDQLTSCQIAWIEPAQSNFFSQIRVEPVQPNLFFKKIASSIRHTNVRFLHVTL